MGFWMAVGVLTVVGQCAFGIALGKALARIPSDYPTVKRSDGYDADSAGLGAGQ